MASATTLDQKKNFSLATSTTPLGTGDTSWTLTAGQGAELPATSGGAYYAVLWDETSSPDNPFRSSAGFEIVRINTLSTDTISSMTRAQQGTSAIALTVGPSFAIAVPTTKSDWDAVRKMIQEQASNFALAGGSADVLTLTLSPVPTAYVDGAEYKFEAAFDSTSATPSLNVNGLGPKTIVGHGTSFLPKNAIKVGNVYKVVYVEATDIVELTSITFTEEDISRGRVDSGTCLEASNVYTFTPAIDMPSFYKSLAGANIRFVCPATNTGVATLVIGADSDAIVKGAGTAILAGDMIAGVVITLSRRVDNGEWYLVTSNAEGPNITNQTSVSAASGDELLIADVSDSNNPKKVTAGSIAALSVASDFISAYDTTTQSVAVPNTFQDVTFDNNGELDGWTHTAATADFTCPTTAKYLVTYTGHVTKTTGSNSTIEVIAEFNGVEVAGSQGGALSTVNNAPLSASASFILDGVATQVLTFRFTGGTTDSDLVPIGGNAVTSGSIIMTVTKL